MIESRVLELANAAHLRSAAVGDYIALTEAAGDVAGACSRPSSAWCWRPGDFHPVLGDHRAIVHRRRCRRRRRAQHVVRGRSSTPR
ncbi:MAG: hypothetical protein MZV49_14450 [Rhodopseudomonas palustris]|nr:hypothetical protein [Rhodopseudomonas palustris]